MAKKNAIKFDPDNFRKHSDKNKGIIRKSLEELGAGRSVLLDKEDYLIAGNGVYEQAQELGLKVRVIESDGTELIAIKRTDLSQKDEKRKLLALVDNHASDTSEFDVDIVIENFDIETLESFEFPIPEPPSEVNYRDLSDKLTEQFHLEITCKDEADQEKLYNELLERGYAVKILNL